MQATRAVLGGDRKFNYPKYVWTPAGGWWHHPVNGPRNTRIAALAIVAVAIPIMMVSASKEVRPQAGAQPSLRHCRLRLTITCADRAVNVGALCVGQHRGRCVIAALTRPDFFVSATHTPHYALLRLLSLGNRGDQSRLETE